MTRAADKLITQLTEEISSGILRPGDQLEEAALAEKYALSRTPIRCLLYTSPSPRDRG